MLIYFLAQKIAFDKYYHITKFYTFFEYFCNGDYFDFKSRHKYFFKTNSLPIEPLFYIINNWYSYNIVLLKGWKIF